MNTINPILVLAGSTATVGNRMFAESLINADTGIHGVVEVLHSEGRLEGLLPVYVAQWVDTQLKREEVSRYQLDEHL